MTPIDAGASTANAGASTAGRGTVTAVPGTVTSSPGTAGAGIATASEVSPTTRMPRAGLDPSSGHRPASTIALPVALQLGGRHAEAVRRWVEGVLGWQPIDAATAGLVPPTIELRDLAPPPSSSPSSPFASPPPSSGPGRVPSVLLVDDDAAPIEVARASLTATADDLIGWPSERERLASVVAELIARPRAVAGETRVLRVGGSAGGVGTSTIVLALAGLSGWTGARALAAVRSAGSMLRGVPAAALSGADLWSQAEELPGLASARALRITDAAVAPDPCDARIDVAILDAGIDGDVDVLVCRPDAAALAALPATTAAAVVIVGEGPARGVDLQRAADGRRALQLPWSARVARAGLTGRVPAGLPGAWLRRLAPLAPVPTRSGVSDPVVAERPHRPHRPPGR